MRTLLLAWLMAVAVTWLPAQLSPPAGTYLAPLRLDAVAPEGAQVVYRFLEAPDSARSPWTGPLVLDALPGETRTYGLRVTSQWPSGESVTKDLRYQVSRPADPIATVQPEPGRYTTGIVVQPSLPKGWRLTSGSTTARIPLNLDAPLGQQIRFTLEATGPSGQKLVWDYWIDRRDQEVLGVDIVSPTEGTWRNAQTLAVSFRGVDKVVWNYGAKLDLSVAQDYFGPRILDRAGLQTVTVAGRSRRDGHWVERHLTWTNGDLVEPVAALPPSGAHPEGLSFPDLSGLTLSWDEGRSWVAGSSAFSEPSSQVNRKVLSLQIRRPEGFFRSFYWLDARSPEAPTLQFIGGWNPRLVLEGQAETSYRVVWVLADGQSVEAPERLWGPSGFWKVPDGVVAARVQALGTNGLESPTATVGFAETGWSTPVWEPWDQKGPQVDSSLLPLGGRVLPRPGFWPVYEVSERPGVAEPSVTSPLLDGAFLPVFPSGSDRTLYVRFAWRDAGGLVGPASGVHAVRVDRVPPSVPDVTILGGKVLVKPAEGEEEGETLWWALSSDRTAAESLSFQAYTGALDAASLRSGQASTLWFHARAQDRAGNTGPARLNTALAPQADADADGVVQVDPDPSIGETRIANEGVYPWPLFRLRALDQGRDLWVGITDQSGPGDDWASKVQPWSGILSRGIARGERRTFVVFWNAKTATGWAWPRPKTLTLTLDQSPPVAPILTGTWPNAPLGGPWTLSLRPGRSGDTIQYSFSLDGSVPSDPLVSGEPWPGSRTWDAPASGPVVVRVRVAVVAVSGIGMEMPLWPSVVLDKTVPAAVAPALEPFTYRTASVVVPPPPEAAPSVRYSLTVDGSLPEVPSLASPLVPPKGLTLEGKEGASLLYRLRWRSFSASGVAGPVTDVYGVLIDRNASARSPGLGPVVKTASLRLSGVPTSALSAGPVTLRADGPEGLVRFEVREGFGAPLAVSPDSRLWSEPLVLDSGEGVDRSYAVSLRAYSPEGQPLTEEVVYPLRIDRLAPEAPSLELVANPRRPEAALKWKGTGPNPEETLYYRWQWDSFGSGPGEGPWTVWDGQPVFSAPGGALTRLTMQAYLKDEAGNLGPTIEQSLLIDQNVVYLTAKGVGLGTRSDPSGNVNTAVERARLEGKSILLVGAGSYLLSKTLDLSGLTVYGGLTERWEATAEPTRSVWSTAPRFDGSNVLVSEGRPWSLSSIDLVSTAKVTAVVSVRGAQSVVRNASWTLSGAPAGWDQEGGSVDWANVTLNYAAEPRGVLLRWSRLEAQVRTLRLTATQNQGGQLVSLSETKALFRDLLLISKRALGFDGIWSAVRSQLTVDQARVQAGDGAERVSAFVLKETEASFWNTDVSLYGTASNTGFQTTGGRLEIQKGSLSLLAGREFNQGFVLDRTTAVLQSLEVKVESGAYQGAFTVDGGSLSLGAAKVKLAGGGVRVWGGQFLSPTLVLVDDVDWVLENKTAGELWERIQPWKDGSTVKDSSTTGW